MDIDRNMTAQENLSGSEIGGATNSVPQVDPVFSYGSDFGDIHVYVVRGKSSLLAIASSNYGDTIEFAYSAKTLLSGSNYEVYSLIAEAEELFGPENNPFSKLIADNEALSELYSIIEEIISGDLNE